MFTCIASSQTTEEMKQVGIKKNVIKTINKKFDGSLTKAINKWADSGNGKLSKKLTEAAEKLGYNEIYLEKKLKLARKERLKQGILGTLALATAVATASAAGSGYSGGGYGGNGYGGDYGAYYQNEKYDVSNSNKTYDMSSLPSVDYSSIDNNEIINYEQSTYDIDQYNSFNPFETYVKIKDDKKNELDKKISVPVIYGNSSSYVNGVNTVNTGMNSAGDLQIYDPMGKTLGTVIEKEDGYRLYKEGQLVSYTQKPKDDGLSVTYVNGQRVSSQLYDSEGNITLFDQYGQKKGYSRKVRGGYENYDASGSIISFTTVEDKKYKPSKYNPLENINAEDYIN